MRNKAVITINRPREGVERLWRDSEYRPDYIDELDPKVRFVDAPGERGTEIHVELEGEQGSGVAKLISKVRGAVPRAKVMDDLRLFKQHVETGVITRSEGVPEGERAERKLKQHPAQPLAEDELEKAGV